jgi:hypothetical protein
MHRAKHCFSTISLFLFVILFFFRLKLNNKKKSVARAGWLAGCLAGWIAFLLYSD